MLITLVTSLLSFVYLLFHSLPLPFLRIVCQGGPGDTVGAVSRRSSVLGQGLGFPAGERMQLGIGCYVDTSLSVHRDVFPIVTARRRHDLRGIPRRSSAAL